MLWWEQVVLFWDSSGCGVPVPVPVPMPALSAHPPARSFPSSARVCVHVCLFVLAATSRFDGKSCVAVHMSRYPCAGVYALYGSAHSLLPGRPPLVVSVCDTRYNS
jgi:hypothetical protein